MSLSTPNPQISIANYCENPEKYKNQLSETTIQYYNSVCLNMKNPPDIKESDYKKILSVGAQGILNTIEGMLSPEGIAGLAVLFGSDFFLKKLSTFADLAFENAIPQIIKIGELIIKQTGIAVTEALIRSLGGATVLLASASIKVASFVFETVNAVGFELLVIGIIGAIFDAWDPCDLKAVMGRDSLMKINDSLHKVFQEKVLSDIGSFKNQQGEKEYINNYPIEYFCDLILKDFDNQYMYKLTLYNFYYLNNLVYNSQGELIQNMPSNLPNYQDINILIKNMSYWIADGNIVVENWIIKWGPVLIGLAILFIFIIFLL